MMETVLILTAGVLLASMAWVYLVTRDALHPLIYLCPLIGYQYVFRPAVLSASGLLEGFFPDQRMLVPVLVLNLAGVGLFCLGGSCGAMDVRRRMGAGAPWNLTPYARQQIFRVACILGTLALAAHCWTILRAGGLMAAYGRAKGGGSASSGYIGEAPLLALPAIVLLLISWRGRRLRLRHFALILLFAAPQLMKAFLGSRRGPTFLILATFLFSWYLLYARRVSLRKIVLGVGVIGIVVLTLKAHRSEIYLGSDFDFNARRVVDEIIPDRVGGGEDFIFSSGAIILAQETGRFHWGKRFAANYLVRPIPRQLWPTKYEDLGLGWMATQEDMCGFTDREWLDTVGWIPARGAAAGFVADLFMEFSWAALACCFAYGAFYGFLWRKARLEKGVWNLLYLEAAVLSIYVPTQSVEAVFHRYLFVCVPTLILWRVMVSRHLRRPGPLYFPAAQRWGGLK